MLSFQLLFFAQLRWRIAQIPHWQGKPINRFAVEYQKLLDRAYNELSKDTAFIEALENTAGKELVHLIEKNNARKTVLTEYEFVSRLKRIRDEVFKR